MDIKDLGGLGAYAPIFEELYKDMAQPAARNIGLALGAITSIGLFLHLLSSWSTDRLNICLKKNLDEYAERMKDVPPEDVSEVPPEIGVPIIEKLSYVTNEELRKLYIELLAKASIKEENDKAHPNFVNIINSISPDEAILLKFIKEKEWLSFVDVAMKAENYKQYIIDELVCIYPNIGLTFENNLTSYIYNLSANGIVNILKNQSIGDANEYNRYKIYLNNKKNHYESIYSDIQNVTSREDKYSLIKGVIGLTDYGKFFLRSVNQ